jgi:hypothetical protein
MARKEEVDNGKRDRQEEARWHSQNAVRRGTPISLSEDNGFRQSLGTTDWREAQAREKKLIGAAEQGQLSASSGSFARLLFQDAAMKYLDGRLPELAESSQQKERQLLVKLKEYFRGEEASRHLGGGCARLSAMADSDRSWPLNHQHGSWGRSPAAQAGEALERNC